MVKVVKKKVIKIINKPKEIPKKPVTKVQNQIKQKPISKNQKSVMPKPNKEKIIFPEVKKQQTTPKFPEDQSKKKRKPGYKFVGQISFRELLGRALPPEFIPTEKSGKILGYIFILVLCLALVKFPYGNMISGDLNVTAQVGTPYPFFEFNLLEPEGIPIRVKGLLIDILIYILIAYIIDVMINFAKKISFISNLNKEKGKYPRFYRDMRPKNAAEAITKKVFKKSTPKEPIQKKFKFLKDRRPKPAEK